MKMGNENRLENLRKAFIRASGEVERIKKDMDQLQTVMSKTMGESIVELGLLSLLEWEVEYMFSSRGSSLKFICNEPTDIFNEEIRHILPAGRNDWEPIPLGSFRMYVFGYAVTVCINVEGWSELPKYLSEVKEYGIEKVDLRDLKHSLKCNKRRVVQQRNLVERCADTFTTKPITKNDEGKRE